MILSQSGQKGGTIDIDCLFGRRYYSKGVRSKEEE